MFCLGFLVVFWEEHFMGVYSEGLPSKRIRKCPLYSGEFFLSGGTDMLFAFHEKRYFGASAITFFALIFFGEGFVISLDVFFVFWIS
ncbi:hypothetical protein V8C43DRAFT_261814 [Trichoderma afarasin]